MLSYLSIKVKYYFKESAMTICYDPFGGRWLVMKGVLIIKGYDTLEEAQLVYPDAPIVEDFDDPG
jgi:hypothetical protein